MPNNPILAQARYRDVREDISEHNYFRRHNPQLDQEGGGLANSDLSAGLAPFVTTELPDEYVELGASHPLMRYAKKSEEDIHAPPVYESHVTDHSHGSIWGNLGIHQHSFVGFRFTALRQDTHTLERVQMRIGFGMGGLRNDIDETSNLSVQVPTNYEAIERAFVAIPGLGARAYSLLTYNCNSFAAAVAGVVGATEIQNMHTTLGPVGAYKKMQAYMEEHGNANEEDALKFFTVHGDDFDTVVGSTRGRYEDMEELGDVYLPMTQDEFVEACQEALNADKSIWKRLFFRDKMSDMQTKITTLGQSIAQTEVELDELPARDPQRRALAVERARAIATETRGLASLGGRRFPVSSEVAVDLAGRFERYSSILSSDVKKRQEMPHAIALDRIIGEKLAANLTEVEALGDNLELKTVFFQATTASYVQGSQGVELGRLILSTCDSELVNKLQENVTRQIWKSISHLSQQMENILSKLKKSNALLGLIHYTMTTNPLFVSSPTLLSNLYQRTILSFVESLWEKAGFDSHRDVMKAINALHMDKMNSLTSTDPAMVGHYARQEGSAQENQRESYDRVRRKAVDIATLLDNASIQVANAIEHQNQEEQ